MNSLLQSTQVLCAKEFVTYSLVFVILLICFLLIYLVIALFYATCFYLNRKNKKMYNNLKVKFHNQNIVNFKIFCDLHHFEEIATMMNERKNNITRILNILYSNIDYSTILLDSYNVFSFIKCHLQNTKNLYCLKQLVNEYVTSVNRCDELYENVYQIDVEIEAIFASLIEFNSKTSIGVTKDDRKLCNDIVNLYDQINKIDFNLLINSFSQIIASLRLFFSNVKEYFINSRVRDYIYEKCQIVNKEIINLNENEKVDIKKQLIVIDQYIDNFDKYHFGDKSNHDKICKELFLGLHLIERVIMQKLNMFLKYHDVIKTDLDAINQISIEFSRNINQIKSELDGFEQKYRINAIDLKQIYHQIIENQKIINKNLEYLNNNQQLCMVKDNQYSNVIHLFLKNIIQLRDNYFELKESFKKRSILFHHDNFIIDAKKLQLLYLKKLFMLYDKNNCEVIFYLDQIYNEMLDWQGKLEENFDSNHGIFIEYNFLIENDLLCIIHHCKDIIWLNQCFHRFYTYTNGLKNKNERFCQQYESAKTAASENDYILAINKLLILNETRN